MISQQRIQTNLKRKSPWSARLQSPDSLKMKISKSSVETQEKDEGGLQRSETQQEPPGDAQEEAVPQSSLLSFQTLPNFLANVEPSHPTTDPSTIQAVSTVSSVVSQAVPQAVPPVVSPPVSQNFPRSGSSCASVSVTSPVEKEIYEKMVLTLEKNKLQGRDKENVFKGRDKLVEVLALSYTDINQLCLKGLVDLAFEKVFPYNSAGPVDTRNQPKQPNARMPCLQGPYNPGGPADTRNQPKQPNTRMPCLQGQGVRPTGGHHGRGVRQPGGPQGGGVRQPGGPQGGGVRQSGGPQGRGVRQPGGPQGREVRPPVRLGTNPHLQALQRIVAPNQHQRNVPQIRQPQQPQQPQHFMSIMNPMSRPQYDTQSSHPIPQLYPFERHNPQMPHNPQLYPHRPTQQAAENADKQPVIEYSSSERRSAIDKIGSTSRATTTQYLQQMELQRFQQMQNVSQLSQHYPGGYYQEYHEVSS